MDLIEAQIIIDILKTGSKYYKPSERNISNAEEGIFIEYCSDLKQFIVKRYESDDWVMHYSGYDRKMIISEQELLKLFTGYSNDHTWWPLYETNNYYFDFDKIKPCEPVGKRIISQMDARDLVGLRCIHCKSKNVEPLEYSTSINPGEAKRYVDLKVLCNVCQKESAYSWDD